MVISLPESGGAELQKANSRRFALLLYGELISACSPSLQLILVEGSLVEIFAKRTSKLTESCSVVSKSAQQAH